MLISATLKPNALTRKRGWNDIILLFRRLSLKTARMFFTLYITCRAPSRTNKSFCLLIFCFALKLEHVSGVPPPRARNYYSSTEYVNGGRGEFGRESLTCSENLAASIAAGRELGIVAVAAVDFVRLGAELLVHQGHSALAAQEARLMPVLVFVGKVLKYNTKTAHIENTFQK
jgi:hypothetical protein